MEIVLDIYERLTQDHDTQREMARKLAETSGDSAERRALFEKFKLELESHANAEEQTFYATLIEKPEGQEKARHSIAEHKDAADLIEELENTDMGTGAWLQKFEKLKHEVIHHVDEEEQEVFVLAKTLIAGEKANSLVAEFDDRKADERVELST